MPHVRLISFISPGSATRFVSYLNTEINVEPCNGEMQAASSAVAAPSRMRPLHKQRARQFVMLDLTQLLSSVVKVAVLTLGRGYLD